MPFGMTDAEYARFTSGEELPPEEAYRLRELKMASIMGTPSAASPTPSAPPPGIAPDFYQAMLAAGAPPHVPETPVQAAPSAPSAPPIPLPFAGGPPAAPAAPAAPSAPPALPPMLNPLPQQAPAISAMSPAPKAPAVANINNNVTMPQKTFAPAQQRPNLPTFLNASLAPNLGNYGPMPSMPGYGMPRTGAPFRPAAPQSLPTFAAFANPSYAPQPIMQDQGLYGGFGPGRVDSPGLNLFNRY